MSARQMRERSQEVALLWWAPRQRLAQQERLLAQAARQLREREPLSARELVLWRPVALALAGLGTGQGLRPAAARSPF